MEVGGMRSDGNTKSVCAGEIRVESLEQFGKAAECVGSPDGARPVDGNAVEVVLLEECDGIANERSPGRGVGHKSGEVARQREAADGHQRL